MTREDLLLFLVDGAEGPYPMDPIRLMKGAFLAWERGKPEWKGLFNFSAYDYGPFDSDVYRARDRLEESGLLEVSRNRYPIHALTQLGKDRVAELRETAEQEADWIKSVGRYVTTRSFDQLLREVYAAHPSYATHSMHRQ